VRKRYQIKDHIKIKESSSKLENLDAFDIEMLNSPATRLFA
jgi:hypothetical protein